MKLHPTIKFESRSLLQSEISVSHAQSVLGPVLGLQNVMFRLCPFSASMNSPSVFPANLQWYLTQEQVELYISLCLRAKSLILERCVRKGEQLVKYPLLKNWIREQ